MTISPSSIKEKCPFSKHNRSEGVVAERRIFFLHALQGWSGREPRFLRPSVRTYVRAAGRRPPVPQKHQNMCKHSTPFKVNGLGAIWGTHIHLFVYEHLRKHTPMQRSVHFDICPFGTRACHMGSKKRSKQFKLNGLGCFGEACFEGPIWTIQIAKSFPCSAALVFFFAEALPCSAALILQLLVFLVVPHVGPSERVRNVMK